MTQNTFTVSFLTGSGSKTHYVAQLCAYCHPSDPQASKTTIQGRHWLVIRAQGGFKTAQEARAAADAMQA